MGSGLTEIAGKLNNKAFAQTMEACKPFFKIFTASGGFILIGLVMIIVGAWRVMRKKEATSSTAKDESSLMNKNVIL